MPFKQQLLFLILYSENVNMCLNPSLGKSSKQGYYMNVYHRNVYTMTILEYQWYTITVL